MSVPATPPSSILAELPTPVPSSKLGLPRSGGLGGAPRSGSATAARRTGGVLVGENVCVFWLAGSCYALDVAFVGEVLASPPITRIPRSPSSVLGMCNVRGTALAIVDLSVVLDLPQRDSAPLGKQYSVLVFRSRSMLAGGRIDRAEAVYRFDDLNFKNSAAMREHPAARGLLETDDGTVATLLDGEFLFSRLDALKYRKQRAE